MNKKRIEDANDADMAKSLQALQRAAQRARILATQTGTNLIVQPLDLEYLRAVEGTLSEWAGSADEEAYREL